MASKEYINVNDIHGNKICFSIISNSKNDKITELTHDIVYNVNFDITSKCKYNPLILNKMDFGKIKITNSDEPENKNFLIFDMECTTKDNKTIINSIGYIVVVNMKPEINREFFINEEYAKINNTYYTNDEIALNFLLLDILHFKPCIIGYNVKTFDIPILETLYPNHQLIKTGVLNYSFDFYFYLLENKDRYNVKIKKGSLKMSMLLDIHLRKHQHHQALMDSVNCWDLIVYFLNIYNLPVIIYKNDVINDITSKL